MMIIKRIPTSFCDLLFSCLFAFFLLWFLSVIKNQEANKESITEKPKAEYLITVTWPAPLDSDVDSWIKMVGGDIVGFNRREGGQFILHNDNTNKNYGKVGDVYLKEAVEEITINGKIPGIYQFSLHGYRIKQETKAKVQVRQMNPYKVLLDDTFEVIHKREKPIIEFVIDENKQTSQVITDSIKLEEFLNGNLP